MIHLGRRRIVRETEGDCTADLVDAKQIQYPCGRIGGGEYPVVGQSADHLLGRHTADHETHHRDAYLRIADNGHQRQRAQRRHQIIEEHVQVVVDGFH